MADVRKIRGFLLQLPKPALVRINGDGEPQEIKPGKSYVKCAESIVAVGGDSIEALDANGKLLRAMRLDDQEMRRSDAAEIPKGIELDPSALMLTHFANLLHRAYEHSTEMAFVKIIELVEKMNERSESIEQRLERAESMNRRLVQEAADDAIDRVEERAAAEAASGNGSLLDTLVQSYVQGAMARGATPTGKPAPNGKGHS